MRRRNTASDGCGVLNVTLVFGADGATFDRLEPFAAAVLASARFSDE
jgi:hypothetical protein